MAASESTATRRLALAWVVFGAIALFASFMLTNDRIRLLMNPEVSLICDISPFVACGPVMESNAGALFGFPNPILGLVCFTIMVTSGMVLLAGAKFRPWYWAGMLVGLTLAAVFITWLQTQSLWVIGALCLWCMVVWATTIPLVVLTFAHAFAFDRLGRGRRSLTWLHEYRWLIIGLWYLAIVTAIGLTFYREFAFIWFGVVL